MALKGSNVLLLVDNGTGFTPVGEQTNLTLESTQNLIEVTSKDDNHQKFLPGKKGDTIELEAFYVPDDAAYGLLKTAYDNGELIVVRRSEDGGTSEVEEASAWIGSISRNAPDGEAATVTISLTLNESWTAVV
jgi:TP901-1 family phage major tail protein